MRKLSADYIFTGTGLIQQNKAVLLDKGTVAAVLNRDEISEPSEIEHYEGILSPGFVNAHCHLELSHLKGRIAERTGLDGFIKDIEKYRNEKDFLQELMLREDQQMYENGIVAVGDISNSNDSFRLKSRSKIQYHTFIELFAFHPSRAKQVFERGQELLSDYKEQVNGRVSLNPHAPYSVSAKLFKLISDEARKAQLVLSMHNQESEDEDLLFRNKSGKILNRLESFGIDSSFFIPSGKSALQSVGDHFKEIKVQLVHNIFTTADDIAYMQATADAWWCFCPNANNYIENRLPGPARFPKDRITLGTDSLASNYSLSMLSEMLLLQDQLSTEELLQAATHNGAEFLGFEKLGSFEKGKKPGVVNISHLTGTKFTSRSAAKLLAEAL